MSAHPEVEVDTALFLPHDQDSTEIKLLHFDTCVCDICASLRPASVMEYGTE